MAAISRGFSAASVGSSHGRARSRSEPIPATSDGPPLQAPTNFTDSAISAGHAMTPRSTPPDPFAAATRITRSAATRGALPWTTKWSRLVGTRPLLVANPIGISTLRRTFVARSRASTRGLPVCHLSGTSVASVRGPAPTAKCLPWNALLPRLGLICTRRGRPSHTTTLDVVGVHAQESARPVGRSGPPCNDCVHPGPGREARNSRSTADAGARRGGERG